MHTFEKKHRLLKKQDFNDVFKEPSRFSSHGFTFLYKENAHKHARIGIALSKKIINKSFERNKVKRLLRESFRLQSELPAIDIVVLAKPRLSRYSYREIRTNLDGLWHTLSEQYKHQSLES